MKTDGKKQQQFSEKARKARALASYENVGRPSIIDEIVLQKLEYAFTMDSTDEEACTFADISPATLYNYQKEHPEFLERKKMLKLWPVLKARQTVVKALDTPIHAEWYLQRKRKNEFSERSEHIGIVGVFSMSDLRRKMKDNSINIIQNDENI